MEGKKIEIEKLKLPLFEEQKDHYIKINCPSCNTIVDSANIDLSSQVGKCSNCQALFSVKEQVNMLSSITDRNEAIARPEGVDIYHFKDEMEIEVAQPYPILDTIILSLFPFIFLFAILLYFFKNMQPGLLISGIALLLTVKSILRLVKKKDYKTILQVSQRSVEIRHRPQGAVKDKKYEVVDIDQIYAMKTHDGVGLFFVINGTQGQRHEQVIKRSTNVSHLKYIEQEMEKYLGISNRPITGEL